MTHPETGRFVWRKSTHSSAQSECVEVADNIAHVVGIRDSKNPNGSVHAVSRTAWRAFVQAVVSDRL